MYAIMDFQRKKADQIISTEAHNENRHLVIAHTLESILPYHDFIRKRIAETDCPVRCDAVVLIDTKITGTAEFLNALRPDMQKLYFERATSFLKMEIGAENIVSAVIHTHGSFPHIHLCFVPITKDKRLCAKRIIGNRSVLHGWQDRFFEYMRSAFPTLQRRRIENNEGEKTLPKWMLRRAGALEKKSQRLLDTSSEKPCRVDSAALMRSIQALSKQISDFSAKQRR